MGKKIILAAGLGLALAATVMGQGRVGTDNYNFPSPWNPAGLPKDQVTQYVLYVWDDNGYSGAYGSEYNGPAFHEADKSDGKADGVIKNEKSGYNWETADRVGGTKAADAVFDAPQNWGTGVGTFENRENIVENGPGQKIGMAWALHELANGGKTGGKKIPMTFNMITGLFVNVWGGAWDDRESMFGWYVPSSAEGSHKRIPSVNVGRDMGIYKSIADANGGATQAQSNSIYRLTKELFDAGAEIGNHTLDHMETNSRTPGPASQFNNVPSSVPGLSGVNFETFWGVKDTPTYGFATADENVTPWGTKRKESDEFGQDVGNTAQQRGWALYAGKFIDKQAWKNAVQLSEHILTNPTSGQNDRNGYAGLPAEQIYGFRAPRLEVNSGLYYALKELNYLYDGGLEEGYENHRNGQNFVWPYTLDNGVQNSWTQYSSGNRVFLDSTPAGLWEIPTNVVVVPDNIRDAVWQNYSEIMAGAGTPVSNADKEDWKRHGKITAYDFNMWILYGMTYDNWMATMKNTLNLRLKGNKAPFHFGCHTDYHSINYDYGTLKTDFNKNGWGLCVERGWNNYKDRQRGMEDFAVWATSSPQNAEFVTGKQLIDEIKKLVKTGEAKGKVETALKDVPGISGEWTFAKSEMGSTSNLQSASLDNLTGSVSLVPNEEYAVFATDFAAGTLTGMTHLSLNYKQTSAVEIRFVLEDETVRVVTLEHRYPTRTHIDGFPAGDNGNFDRADLRYSGKIPVSAFDFPTTQDRPMNYSATDMSKVVRIEIQPLAPFSDQPEYGLEPNYGVARAGNYDAKFEFKDFTIYTGTPFDFKDPDIVEPNPQPGETSIKGKTGVNGRVKSSLSLAGMTANALRLNISKAGMYNVKIFSANGRMLQAFDSHSLTTGLNTLKLNNLAAGVYMIKVQGIDTKQQLTKSALVF